MDSWNWQRPQWPVFVYNAKALEELKYQFSREAGFVFGVYSSLSISDQDSLRVELISSEADNTSQIEGEYLGQSLQSSV